MKPTTIAKRYAQALFDVSQEHNQAETINEQLRVLSSLLENDPGFQQFLMDKRIGFEDKQALIKTVFADSLSPLLVNFLCLVIEKNREEVLAPAISVFNQLWLEYLGILPVQLTTAKNINVSLEKQLSAALKTSFGKEIIFKYTVDPSLIGGAVIKIGDLMIDGSLKTKIDNIHKQLTK